MSEASAQLDAVELHSRLREALDSLVTVNAAALSVGAAAFALYLRTMLPGISFGDWAEPALMLPRLGVLHPTGYPLYSLVGKLFTMLPLGSVAWRATLLSVVAGAGAVGVTLLVAVRLGVRPLVAVAAGLTLAVTGTLWREATYAKMNSLHLFLVALVVHRALVWRSERRDRDLLLGALLGGLAIANHALAVTVVPIVVLFVLVDARRRITQRPVVLLQAGLLFLAGASLYLFIPLRALAGPADVYGPLLTWNGFSSLVTGAMFRSDMHFGTVASVVQVWHAAPGIVGQIVAGSNWIFAIGAGIGAVILVVRDRWAGLLLALVLVSDVYFFANYRGDLGHYLLVAWFVLALWLAVAAETLFVALDRIVTAMGSADLRALAPLPLILLVVPISIAGANWTSHDQSRNHLGETFANDVFAALPPNAVLVTYWDALTTLSYEHCILGRRPDVELLAYDSRARVTCDPESTPLPLGELARHRPVFALMPFRSFLSRLAFSFQLVPGPVIAMPYGQRYPQFAQPLYRLQ